MVKQENNGKGWLIYLFICVCVFACAIYKTPKDNLKLYSFFCFWFHGQERTYPGDYDNGSLFSFKMKKKSKIA